MSPEETERMIIRTEIEACGCFYGPTGLIASVLEMTTAPPKRGIELYQDYMEAANELDAIRRQGFFYRSNPDEHIIEQIRDCMERLFHRNQISQYSEDKDAQGLCPWSSDVLLPHLRNSPSRPSFYCPVCAEQFFQILPKALKTFRCDID